MASGRVEQVTAIQRYMHICESPIFDKFRVLTLIGFIYMYIYIYIDFVCFFEIIGQFFC